MPPFFSEFPVFCVGLSHHTASVDHLERASIAEPDLSLALGELASKLDGEGRRAELVVLSTCNRTEIYGSWLPDPELPPAALSEAALRYLLSRLGDPDAEGLLYSLQGVEAARHLFRVASGVESLVVGEAQILAQVGRAHAAAQAAGTTGPVISLLFQSAVRCGRRARAETGIGKSAENISSAAVRRAEAIVGALSKARALVVGTGEMGRLALKSLRSRGAIEIDLVNRSEERAREVAARWGARARRLRELPGLLAASDLVVSSTSAPEPIISRGMVLDALRDRGGRPLVLIDIAVPRDVDPRVRAIPGVHLIDIDALKGLDGGGLDAELPAVERVIEEELGSLSSHLAEYALRPVIAELWRKAEEIRSEVLEHTRSRLSGLDEESWGHVESLADALVNKLLHLPATRLRAEAANGRAYQYVEALRYLFDLPPSRDATS